MNDLIEKIKNEIMKSGFPLEIYCKQVLESNQWSSSGPTYVTLDEKIQELDVIGHRQNNFDHNLTAFYNIHIACKKCTNNHWVFFKESKVLSTILVRSHFIDDLNIDVFPLSILERFQSDKVIKSKIYTMAFQSKKNQIYSAINELLSSYKFFSQFYDRHREEKKPLFNIINFDFLTILFDGKLFSANVEDNGDLNIAETPHILHYHHEVDWPKHKHFTIEIITKEYFDQYLKELENDYQQLSENLEQILKLPTNPQSSKLTGPSFV